MVASAFAQMTGSEALKSGAPSAACVMLSQQRWPDLRTGQTQRFMNEVCNP